MRKSLTRNKAEYCHLCQIETPLRNSRSYFLTHFRRLDLPLDPCSLDPIVLSSFGGVFLLKADLNEDLMIDWTT